jgi:hypothetical protein
MDEWQKLFVGILVNLGLSHDIAMLVMGKTCDLRQKAYMQGYDHGWAAALNQGKPTAQPTTAPRCSVEDSHISETETSA